MPRTRNLNKHSSSGNYYKKTSFKEVTENEVNLIEKSREEVESRLGTAKWLLVRGILIKVLKNLQASSDIQEILHEKITSTQLYTTENEDKARVDSVGCPLPHISAELAATGEAVFNGDIRLQDMVHISFVLSSIPKGKILSIDSTKALAFPGVLAFYDYHSIPVNGNNFCGKLPVNGVNDDTPILANGEVEYVGQPIGIVVATNVETARRAVKCVEVLYDKATPIIHMQDAIEKKQWLGRIHEYGHSREEVEEAMKACEVQIEGEISIDGQQHIYMEPQTAVAYVGDHNEVVVQASTQSLSNVQQLTAAFLGIPSNKVIVKVKRLGGGFGGKATQSVQPACLASLVALKLKRPASCVYSRQEDFLITGGRHPGHWKYKLGGDADGKLRCLDLKVYLDGGAYTDMSEWVMFVACGTSPDSSYKIPCMRSEGYVVKTNKSSHTAMRGFGKPQATYAMECILRHFSHKIKKDCDEIQEMNFNGKGFRTHFGTNIHSDSLLDVYNELKQFSRYYDVKKEVKEFNKQHLNKKRGVSLSTVRFGLTQGGHMESTTALVQIYLDGSVAISIGGIEMGQGLSTKMQQVASRALNIPIDYITVLCGSTDKTANAPETGGSQGTDLHGRAVQIACARLMEQIDPLRKEKSNLSWPEIALEAYKQQLPLQASENIKINRKKYGIEENSPTYFTTGAACVVLELDCLTGDHVVTSVDIVMDVGKSLNPALDIGQIEGAFVQGYGQFVSESIPYDLDSGRPLLDSIAKYKAPTPYMVPRQFRVKLMKDGPGFPEQVYSSKGIGEPPIMLSVACYTALLDAVHAFLSDKKGNTEFVQHDAPLTRNKLLEILHQEYSK
ncbi:unnamed protein product [Auanema sp. JU1783]|nr:unnamed protein product [Auanema sp. JU1783]